MNPSPAFCSRSKLFIAPILLGAIFGTASILQSLYQGQLSVPITYDDIMYFVDAAERLQGVYDFGMFRFVRDYVANPPHSPLATMTAFVAFLTMGMHDWAPAALNTLWLMLLLGGIRWTMREQPLHHFLYVALAVLAWPLTGQLIIESRPDIVNGLLVAFGVLRLVGQPWVRSGKANLILVSVVFGIALLCKPSISPITFVLYMAGLVVSSFLDIRSSKGEIGLREAVVSAAKSLGIVALIAGPHYALNFKETFSYIWVTTFGAQKDLWALKMPWYRHLGFYLVGSGGKMMMGKWLFITIISMIASAIAVRRLKHSINPRLIGIAVCFSLAFLLVTIPAHKSPHLGVVVPCFFFFFFVQSWATLSKAMEKTLSRPPVAIATGLTVCVLAMSLFNWHWYFRSGGRPAVEDGRISLARHELLNRVTDVILTSRSRPIRIYFPVISSYLTSEILQFHLLKQRTTEVRAYNAHRSGDPGTHLKNLESSTHVVLLSADDPDTMRSLPSFAVYDQVRAFLESDPQAWRVTKLQNARGDADVLVFARPDPFDIRGESGFLPLEGPYPQWNLPTVRWAEGKEARFLLNRRGADAGAIRFVAQSPFPDQEFTVMQDSLPLGICKLSEPDRPHTCDLAVAGLSSDPKFRLEFARSLGPEDRNRSVLFRQIRFLESPEN